MPSDNAAADPDRRVASLTVAFLESQPTRVADCATALSYEIRMEGLAHLQPKEWGTGAEVDTGPHAYWRPFVYVTWGSFDVAAVYLAPSLDLPGLHGVDDIVTGHHIHQGLLCPRPVGVHPSRDFNAAYWEFHEHEPDPGGTTAASQPPPPRPRDGPQELPFLGFLKAKVSPAVSWRDGAWDEAFVMLWEAIAKWREDTDGQVALAQSSGWSEYIIVAHTRKIEDLLRLSLDVRGLWMPTAWDGTETEPENAHVFLATVTKLGYDAALCADASDLAEQGRSGAGEPLLPLAREIAEPYGDHRSQNVFLRPAFLAYPGHEAIFRDVLSGFIESECPPCDRQDGIKWLAGTRDIVGPTVRPSEGVSDAVAAAYLCLLQYRVLYEPPDDEGVLNYFGCRTEVGFELATDSPSPKLPERVRNHTHHTASSKLMAGLGDAAGQIPAYLRKLQVPYSLNEQVLSMVRAFQFACGREVSWEDAMSLAPAVFCLRDHLKAVWEWAEGGYPPPDEYRFDPCGKEQVSLARHRLEVLHRDLRVLTSALRSTYYNRQLGGYLADETPDVNVRARGSIAQLLAVHEMALDSLTLTLLGPNRASLARLGDNPSPRGGSPCDVIVVDLPVTALRTPFLMDSIAHEMGHLMVKELIRAPAQLRHDSYRPADDWKDVLAEFTRLHDNVFTGTLGAQHTFADVVADFIEWRLLDPDDFERWSASLLLRAVLLVPTTDMSCEGEGPGRKLSGVPLTDTRTLEEVIRRLVHVQIAKSMCDAKDDAWSAGASLQDVRSLRLFLESGCVIGPSQEIDDLVHDPSVWETFVHRHVYSAQWVQWPENARHARRFFLCLRDYVNQRVAESTHVLPWAEVRSHLQAIRTEAIACTRPSRHVRVWAEPGQVRGVRGHALAAHYHERKMNVPWEWAPQAPSRAEGTPVKAVLYQRGRLVPTAFPDRLAEITCDFFASLFRRIPMWRSSLRDRVSVDESTKSSRR